eukprot:gene12313-biopygen16929
MAPGRHLQEVGIIEILVDFCAWWIPQDPPYRSIPGQFSPSARFRGDRQFSPSARFKLRMAGTNSCIYSGSDANAPGPRTGRGRSDAEGGHLVVQKTGIGARWHPIGVGYAESRIFEKVVDFGAWWTPQDGSCWLDRSIPRPAESSIQLQRAC